MALLIIGPVQAPVLEKLIKERPSPLKEDKVQPIEPIQRGFQ